MNDSSIAVNTPSNRFGAYKEFSAGWKVLLGSAAGLIFGATMLPFNTLGAVVTPLSEEFGWGRGEIQLCYLFFTLGSAACYPFIGKLVDRIGSRRVALIGIPAFAAAFATIGLATSDVRSFYLAWVFVGVLGAGTSPITFTAIVNLWFTKNRGLALATTLFLGGISAAAVQICSTYLAEAYGWRQTFFIFALLPLCAAWPLAWYCLHPPATRTVETPQSDRSRLEDVTLSYYRDYRFWLLTLAIGLVTFSISGVVLNLKPLLADRGFDPATAAYLAGALGLALSVSRLATGYLIDRVWAPAVGFVLFLLPVFACWALIEVEGSMRLALTAVILIGVATGGESDLMAFLTAKYFGMKRYGRVYATVFTVFIVSSGVAPSVFGYVFDISGSYDPVLIVAAVCFFCSGVLLLGMGRYPAHNPA
ncbi:MAG: MFS transporter [Xanthomonadales bacterium]|nr:MFS transporter [Xanthomonadales bacterium]